MHFIQRKTSHFYNWVLPIFVCTLWLSACGWVDSTGVGSQSGTANAEFGVAPAGNGENSPAPIELPNVRIVQLQEQSGVRVTPGGLQDTITDWNWMQAVRNEAFPDCAIVGGFDQTLAADTLGRACTSSVNCELKLESAVNGSGRVVFDISLPALKSPVGLSYRLTTYDSADQAYYEYYSFCGISVNEAPLAADDFFTVIKGQTKRVEGRDAINLLSNDVDDVDNRNQPLRINPNAFESPRFAENFSLRQDGGFTYTPDLSFTTDDNTVITDTFVYEVSDSQHTSQARVTLRIVASDTPPQRLARIPDISLFSNKPLSADDPTFNVARFFSDADNDPLQYTVAAGSLPPSGNLVLNEDGIFEGLVDEKDVGDYNVTLIVTDGRSEVTDTFTLSVLPDPSNNQNSAPVIAILSDQIYRLGDRIDIAAQAEDEEGDRVQFNLGEGSAAFVSINRNTGRISGKAEQAGLFTISVIASDGMSNSRRFFFIKVVDSDNRPPLADDIANQVFSEGFSYDVSVFFKDPDGDVMSFSAINLPESVGINARGVITGRPTSNNLGPHFIQVTADDGNLGTVTDGFLLTLR